MFVELSVVEQHRRRALHPGRRSRVDEPSAHTRERRRGLILLLTESGQAGDVCAGYRGRAGDQDRRSVRRWRRRQ
jgi:hypothetical protein